VSRLVGRAEELALLASAFDDLSPVRASWAQVTGEPGIGKTRLVAELCERAETRDGLVLVGRGAELEHDVPFGIVIDALDDYLGSLDVPRLAELCGRQRAEVCRVFPALAGLGLRGDHSSEDERYPIYRALRVLIERLATPGPLLLALDDLHWADSASIELVAFLLRHPPEARVLLVLAWRPGQAPGLADILARGAKDLPGTAVGLMTLAEDEVGELLGGTLEPSHLTALYRASGGNPFYAQALASAADGSGLSTGPGAEEDGGAIPAPVAAAIRHEIDALSLPARLLAQGAAVIGEPFELELSASCADVAPDKAPHALDELVVAGIVHATESPRRFAFRHPIVRRAVYDSAGPGWRVAVHARAAAALAERGAPVTATAHHVARSAAAGDLAAAALLYDAATEVVPHAPRSASAWLGVASAIVARRPETAGTRLALLMARTRVHCVLGELEAAHDALAEALELVAVGDPLRLRLVAGSAAVDHGLGRFAEARATLLGALEEPPAAAPGAAATLCIELAVSWLYTLDLAEATAFATRALQASVGSDRLLEATARALLAFVHASAEEAEANATARAHRTEAQTILDRLGDDEVAARLDALFYLGWAERLLEEYGASAVHLGRAIAVAEAGGGSQWLVPTMIEQVKALVSCGRITEARALADTALEMARVLGVDLVLLLALTAEVGVLAAAGEIEGAIAAGDEALGLGDFAASYHRANVRRQVALARLEAGSADGLLAELAAIEDESAGSDGGGANVTDGMACRLLEARCRAELAGRRGAAARELADEVARLAAVLGSPASAGFACRARARVLAATKPEEALVLLGRAGSLFAQAGALVEAARTRALGGEIRGACGRTAEALAELSEASDALRSYGAFGSADQAGAVLRRLRRAGARPTRRGRPATGAAALSPREREIAELVAEGRTNREIAVQLVLSENTVESHLGRILAKLEVTGRGAVARAISRTGPPFPAPEQT